MWVQWVGMDEVGEENYVGAVGEVCGGVWVKYVGVVGKVCG